MSDDVINHNHLMTSLEPVVPESMVVLLQRLMWEDRRRCVIISRLESRLVVDDDEYALGVWTIVEDCV